MQPSWAPECVLDLGGGTVWGGGDGVLLLTRVRTFTAASSCSQGNTLGQGRERFCGEGKATDVEGDNTHGFSGDTLNWAHS